MRPPPLTLSAVRHAPGHEAPGFVVMVSQNRAGAGGQPLSDRFWGTGFPPTRYQGVKLRGGGDPVLYLHHTRLTYKYQARHFRLTDVHGEVVKQA